MAQSKNIADNFNHRPLERVFQNSYARVLDFLILNQKFDYSFSDIANLAHVTPRTLQRVLPVLLKERLVSPTRKSGKAQMYELNKNSRSAQMLEFYFKAVTEEFLNEAKNQTASEQKIGEVSTRAADN